MNICEPQKSICSQRVAHMPATGATLICNLYIFAIQISDPITSTDDSVASFWCLVFSSLGQSVSLPDPAEKYTYFC